MFGALFYETQHTQTDRARGFSPHTEARHTMAPLCTVSVANLVPALQLKQTGTIPHKQRQKTREYQGRCPRLRPPRYHDSTVRIRIQLSREVETEWISRSSPKLQNYESARHRQSSGKSGPAPLDPPTCASATDIASISRARRALIRLPFLSSPTQHTRPTNQPIWSQPPPSTPGLTLVSCWSASAPAPSLPFGQFPSFRRVRDSDSLHLRC